MTTEPEPQAPGMVVHGGTVNIGSFAHGSHAQAFSVQLSGEDLRDLMRELLAVLRQHDSELADGQAVEAAVGDLSSELELERPDRSRLRALLDKLAAAAGPIADVAAVVAAVQRAISGIG